jgi:hypothetical protein
MKARCADCRKWDYTANNFGFCRANAPVASVVPEGKQGGWALCWPSTGIDDWCMEFESGVVEIEP